MCDNYSFKNASNVGDVNRKKKNARKCAIEKYFMRKANKSLSFDNNSK